MSVPAHRKRYAVFEVLKDGRSVSSIAKELGVARKTVYSWLKRYKKAPARLKKTSLDYKYSSGKNHPRFYRDQIKARLVKLVAKNPELSATFLSKKLRVGRHAVVSLLADLELSKSEDREAFARMYKKPGRFYAEIKAQAAREVIDEKREISEVSDKYGIARKTLYDWIRRYQEEGKIEEKYVSGSKHPKSYSQNQIQAILNSVVSSPELSIHALAKSLNYSSHGIYNVLKKYNLTHKFQRLEYAKAQVVLAPKSAFSKFINRIRLVLEQFIPSLASTPPPRVDELPRVEAGPPKFNQLLKSFFISSFVTFLVFSAVISWVRLLGAQTPTSALGLIFATIALTMGSIFFLYSLKYYLSLAIVLSFGQTESAESTVQRSFKTTA